MKLDKASILIKKAALECDKLSNSVLEAHDLTPAQYKVVKYLYHEAQNGVRLVDLEKYYSMTHPTAIGIVQNLEKKGLVAYKENPHHARSRFIVPTDEALSREAELRRAGETIEGELTKKLSEPERRQLAGLLKKMMGLDEE